MEVSFITQDGADGEEKLARNKDDSEDTTKTLPKDEAFLAMLKENCSTTDAVMACEIETTDNMVMVDGEISTTATFCLPRTRKESLRSA